MSINAGDGNQSDSNNINISNDNQYHTPEKKKVRDELISKIFSNSTKKYTQNKQYGNYISPYNSRIKLNFEQEFTCDDYIPAGGGINNILDTYFYYTPIVNIINEKNKRKLRGKTAGKSDDILNKLMVRINKNKEIDNTEVNNENKNKSSKKSEVEYEYDDCDTENESPKKICGNNNNNRDKCGVLSEFKKFVNLNFYSNSGKSKSIEGNNKNTYESPKDKIEDKKSKNTKIRRNKRKIR